MNLLNTIANEEQEDLGNVVEFYDLAFHLIINLSVIEMSTGKYVKNITKDNILVKKHRNVIRIKIGDFLFIYPSVYSIHFKRLEFEDINNDKRILADVYYEMYVWMKSFGDLNNQEQMVFLEFFKIKTDSIVNGFLKDKGLFRFLFSPVFTKKNIVYRPNDKSYRYGSIFDGGDPKYREAIENLQLYDDVKYKVLDNLLIDRVLRINVNWPVTDDGIVSTVKTLTPEDYQERRKELILSRKYPIQPSVGMDWDLILQLDKEQIENLNEDVLNYVKAVVGLDTKEQIIEWIEDFKQFHVKLEIVVTKEQFVYLYDFEIEQLEKMEPKRFKKLLRDISEDNRSFEHVKGIILKARNQKIKDIKKK